MNVPIAREEDLDILIREEVRRAMRAVKDADFPAIFVARRVIELCKSAPKPGLCQL